jgi:hypothetical protein
VTGDTADRLGEVVIVLELGGLALLPLHGLRLQLTALAGEIPHEGTRGRVVRHPLREDVAGTGQRGIHVGHLPLRRHELRGAPPQLALRRLPLPDQLRQRAESPLRRDGRAGAALRLERTIEILQLRLRLRALEGGAQLRRHLPLLLHGSDDGLAPLGELRQVLGSIADVADLQLVELTRDLLPVACDEGDRIPRAEQLERRGDTAQREGELGGDLCGV